MLSCSCVSRNLANFLSCRVEILFIVDAQILLLTLKHFLGDIGVGSLETKDNRLLEANLLGSSQD